MKKGVVMDIDERFLTLLTPEGEFMRARRQEQQYSIGEEIHFFPIEEHLPSSTLKRSFLLKRKPAWALSITAALLLFLGSLIPMYQDNKAYAYMSIDDKPSIELGVNKKMQVVELTGYNKEGKRVVSDLSEWRKKGVSQVTEMIFSEMKKEGFLKANGSVIISTVRTKNSDNQAEAMLKDNLKEIKDKAAEEQVNIKVFNGTEKDMAKAHKLGITTGKYYETKIAHNIDQDRNVVPNEKESKDSVIPSQPSQPLKSPPGQQRKQLEVIQPGSGKTTNNSKQSKGKQPVGKFVPPGQLKKNTENIINQNYEQLNKINGDQIKQNNELLKKQFAPNNKKVHEHEYKHENEHEHEHSD